MRIIKKTNQVAAFCIAGLFFLSGCNPAALKVAGTVVGIVVTVAVGARQVQAANLDIEKSELEIQALKENGEEFTQFKSLSDEELKRILDIGEVAIKLNDGSTVTLPVNVKDYSVTPSADPTPAREPATVTPPISGGKPSSDVTAQVVGNDLTEPLKNVRAGYNTSEPVLFKLPVGSQVQIIGNALNADDFLWYKIYSPEQDAEGWIAHHLIELN